MLGMLPFIVGLIVVLGIWLGLGISYVVVPANQIHVIVHRGRGRKIYTARAGSSSSYWRIPMLQQRIILPAENVQLEISGISLRDGQMAKFNGDVVAWVNINNPELASERLGDAKGGQVIFNDVRNLIQAITRNTSMLWSIMDILKNRKGFSDAIRESVNKEFNAWGMVLVELEVIHFTDDPKYTVIKDLEERQASIINAETRKLVAMQMKEADIVESTARKDTAVQVANNDELAKIREITRDEAIGKRGAEKERSIAEQQGLANKSAIASQNILLVGKADNEKQALIVAAEGKSQSEILLTATVPAEKVRMGGMAEADVVKAKLLAEGEGIRAKMLGEADGTLRRAEALKLYNEAGIKLELLKASRDVEMNKYDNWGKAMASAKINVYAGGEGGNLFGMPMSPSGAFSLASFNNIIKESGGMDLEKIAESIGGKALPIVDMAKVTPTGKNPPDKVK